MNAHGERNMSAKVSIMMPAANKMVECLLQIMQHAGIKRLRVVSHESSVLRKVHGEAEMFECAPASIAAYAESIKDAIAEIVASIGFVSVEIRATEEETKALSDFYGQLDTLYSIPGYKDTIQANIPGTAASSAADDNAKQEEKQEDGTEDSPAGDDAQAEKPEEKKARKPAVRISKKCCRTSCAAAGK